MFDRAQGMKTPSADDSVKDNIDSLCPSLETPPAARKLLFHLHSPHPMLDLVRSRRARRVHDTK